MVAEQKQVVKPFIEDDLLDCTQLFCWYAFTLKKLKGLLFFFPLSFAYYWRQAKFLIDQEWLSLNLT